MTFIDITGQRFGKLVALAPSDKRDASRQRLWLCRCDCGEEAIAAGAGLRYGKRVSCGCVNFRHGATVGHAKSPEYQTWANMRTRCGSPLNRAFRDYGGRGITVAPEWNDFVVFLRDVGPRPSPEHTLERIDNDGNYEPGNCRWATRGEQARNQRSNRWVLLRGRRMILEDAAAQVGMHGASLIEALRTGSAERRHGIVDCDPARRLTRAERAKGGPR